MYLAKFWPINLFAARSVFSNTLKIFLSHKKITLWFHRIVMYYYYYYIVTGFPFYRWNRNYNNNRKGRDFRMKNKSNIFILFKFGAIVFFTIRTQIFNLFLEKSFTYQIYNMQFKTDVFTNRKKIPTNISQFTTEFLL